MATNKEDEGNKLISRTLTKNKNVNDEIESIRPYKFRPFLLHLNILPFFIAYLVWFYVWLTYFGIDNYPELGMIVTAVIAILQVVTCLFCYWFVEFRVLMQCNSVKNPESAECVQVTPTANNGFAELVYLHHKFILKDVNQPAEKVTWFQFQKTKYILDSKEKKQFQPVEFPINHTLSYYLESKGYAQSEQQILDAQSYFDLNKMVMDIPKFIELFIERATAPFFVFQVFCVLLWCLDEYWYYSVFTLFMLVSFECTLVQQQLKNMQLIRQMGNKPFKILVYRMRKWIKINSDELLPGDICSVSRTIGSSTSDAAQSSVGGNQGGFALPCDMILLRGQCIINESMLTGESVPVIKESIETRSNPKDVFDIQQDGKLHCLFGGTLIVQHTPPPKSGDSGLKAPDNGCIAYVLRTGFNTSQGKLLRTIMFSVKRVTANNLETFLFILFLLIFAIAASSYVWIEGSKDPSRSRYKLLLECALILTSVIPPELPIELALAVNTSLISLVKLGIYCTEPFRIPFAGKIDICCFDKTGTLTSDDLVVEGVAGIGNSIEITSIQDLPSETLYTLATCHTLINLDEELIGDPLEKVTLLAIDWTLTKGDVVIAKKTSSSGASKATAVGWKIYHRFHFSSALKRMSVIAGHTKPGAVETTYIATCKGAPEILKPMIKDLPDNYDEVYLHYAREGARVLCLGYKELGSQLTSQDLRDMSRDQVESGLKFVGFVVISCPLKPDTKQVVKELIHSTHHLTMITGDNPLTACHVASQLRLIDKKHAFVLSRDEDEGEGKWYWKSIVNDSYVKELNYALEQENYVRPTKASVKDNENKANEKVYSYLCLTGEGFDYLFKHEHVLLKRIIAQVKVFARVSPKQKEYVVTMLKSLGYITLMCGDGTNDVGALKHADVGVALLANSGNTSNNVELEQKKKAKISEAQSISNEITTASQQLRNNKNLTVAQSYNNQQSVLNAQKKLNQVLKELEEAEQAHIVKLGDASIASPFTYKQSSIQCVCHIIKQGRCTLVTTLQMFKILALNALILAYSQSVLYLDGIKLSDGQATMQGLLLAGCFLFISRSKPLKTLSKTRPLPNIFNFYTILTVLGQFAIHLCSLVYLVREAHARMPPRDSPFPNLEEEFKPSLVNSTVFIISLSLQVATFAINYKGHPFMESLKENKPLLYSILFSGSAVVVLACHLMPEMSDQFQIVEFPSEFRKTLVTVIALDMAMSFLIDRILEFLFGKSSIKKA